MVMNSSARYTRPWGLLVFFCVLGLPAAAEADEVTLKNGDRLSGRIVRMEGGQLFMESDQAGDVYIDWENVKSLHSDKPLSVRFERGAPVPENVGIRDEDRIIVLKLEAGGPVNLASIRSINQAELYMRGYVSIGGNSTTGNTDTSALNSSLEWLLRLNRHKVSVDATYNRSSASGEVTVENARGGLRYDYFLSRYVFALFQQHLEQDKFQNLTLRSTTTGGLGYELLNYERHELIVGAGPTAVYTDFSTEPAYVDPSATWLVRWYYEVYRDIVKLYHNHQGWKDFGQKAALRLNATQGIRVELYNDINMHVEYGIRLNTKPAPGRKELDTSLIFGLTYEYER